jgi:hypothetical protein
MLEVRGRENGFRLDRIMIALVAVVGKKFKFQINPVYVNRRIVSCLSDVVR